MKLIRFSGLPANWIMALDLIPIKSKMENVLMRLIWILQVSIIWFSLGACAIAPPKFELPEAVQDISDLEPYLKNAVAENQPPSVSIGVIKNNDVVYAKAFGHADALSELEATPDTVYQWWSLTKLFTAVAILQLQERELLSIDDPVAMHLPGFEVRGGHSENKTITIKQLLSHSSGLGDIGMKILGWVHFDEDPRPVQTELFYKHQENYNELENAPGEQGRYSNYGYFTLAALIESVTRQTYEKYIVDNIAIPLGMDSTNFIYTPKMEDNAAKGSHPPDVISKIVPLYLDTDRAIDEKRNGNLWFNNVYSDLKGSSGLIGSVNDLLKFIAIFLPGNENRDSAVLQKDSIRLMMTPVVDVVKSPAPIDNLQFGLGWFIADDEGVRTYTHGGSGMAFVSMLNIYPDREMATVVMANSTYLGRTMGFDLSQRLGEIDW